MDLLDKYKKAWDNQPEKTDAVSKIDIYKMAHSKSSSIVKWIFITGVLELAFWAILNIYFSNIGTYSDFYEELHIAKLANISVYLHYIAIILFLSLFYKNYKAISVSDTTKLLIKKILNVRKTVKYYVFFNIFYSVLVQIVISIFMFSDMDLLLEYYSNHGIEVVTDKNVLLISLAITFFVVTTIMVVILWLIYKLIYGSLLRKLNKNYKELAKLEKLD